MQLPEALTAAAERRQAPGDDPRWSETWWFDFATADAALGGYIRLELRPHQRRCWYWAWVIGAGRQPVLVVDDDVPLPRNRSLEIRTEGLWADHTVEVPFDHVTLGCEAFALRLDHPDDALAANPVGDRVPFGLDLEWETHGRLTPRGDAGYVLPCRVHGEVLVADERLDLDATGHRLHAWGLSAWASPWSSRNGYLGDDVTFHTASPDVPDLTAEPTAHASILVPSDAGDGGGRTGTFTRTLCRFHDAPGTYAGAGWTEQYALP
jgi:hypothetical protein